MRPSFIDGLPVEIQVRTRLQHEGADLFEKLADRVGRGIRYGEPPSHRLTLAERTQLSAYSQMAYEAGYELIDAVVGVAKGVAERIRLYERSVRRFPGHEEVVALKAQVEDDLTDLRARIERMDQLLANIPPWTSN